MDALGLANTFNTPLLEVVADYYRNAISIQHITEIVKDFGNALTGAVEKQIEILRKRARDEGTSARTPRKSALKRQRF